MNKDIKLVKDSYQSYLTILEILKKRNYIIEDDEILSLNIFSKKYEDLIPLNFIYENEITKEKLFLLILKEQKIPKKELINKVQQLKEENNLKNYLLITNDSQIINSRNEINTKFNIDLEIFLIENLQINILKHELQPKFVLFTNEQKEKLLEHKKWQEKNLPKIKLDDPISRYYNAKVGQIFKITRKSMVGRNKTSSQGVYYRIVVE